MIILFISIVAAREWSLVIHESLGKAVDHDLIVHRNDIKRDEIRTVLTQAVNQNVDPFVQRCFHDGEECLEKGSIRPCSLSCDYSITIEIAIMEDQ